jgi:pimeloyl-ACP methyl ester carboxylesterase
VRLHAVIGDDGPPLLLIHGWPGSRYYWRLVMPALARDFEVIAVDQRGIGLSDKPEGGYDAGTLANDLVGLMDALGHQQFSVVGVDTGMLIGYALAADHPERVVRLALGEAPLPGISLPNPLIVPDQVMPVLAMGGAESLGAMTADTMRLTADDVQTLVIPGVGHWLAEEAPEQLVAALTEFLAPTKELVR